MKKISLLLLVPVFALQLLQAQTPLNPNTALVNLSPSFAGSNGFIRSQATFQSMWPTLTGGNVTYMNNFDMYIKPLKSGLALSAIYNNQGNGLLQAKTVALSYARYFSLMHGDLKLVPAIQVSLMQQKLDRSKLDIGVMQYYNNPYNTFGPGWNPDAQGRYMTRVTVDAAASVLLAYKNKLYAGVSVFNLSQPNVGIWGDYKMPYSFNAHVSYNFKFNESTLLQVMYRYQTQGYYRSSLAAANLVCASHLVTGLGFYTGNTPFLSLGYRNNYFSLMGTYGVTMSMLMNDNLSTWELHGALNLRNKEQRKTLTSFESW